MSITHVGLALDTPADLRPVERLVLIQLAQFADADGMAFTSVANLAQRTNTSPTTVNRVVRRLREERLLERIAHRDVAGVCSAYRVTLDRDGAQGGQA
ncbi:helix-turn-helix domain-containing protein [Streptomyces mirabilis]|jgi:DNA-binding MarR family transcriptional regulator|uniref:helix-turn-helix domain-containing protein n=1 Tax=Streptomyces mirabilis TaxID=68239 RepID=UPI0036DBC6FE